MSGGQPAARVGDPIAHSNAGSGMLLGALAGLAVGAVLVAATVATGGAALAVVAAVGATAGLTSFGGLSGMNIGAASMGPVCGALVKGSTNVRVNGRFATMTAQGMATCSHHSGQIPLATGSSSVKINGLFAGRITETLGCSAKVVAACSPDVMIGGPSVADPSVTINPEVPAWAVTALQVLGVAGAVMALPFAIATVGVAATIGGAVLGYVGGEYGGKAGRALGTAMGMSETGIRSMEAGGQFLGGFAGGVAGVKGVQAGRGALAGLAGRTPAGTVGSATAGESLGQSRAGLSSVDQPVYRVDGRPPATIFDEGFKPRGTSTDLENYVNTNQPSTFVGTSKSPDIVNNPAFGQPGRHLYEIDGRGLKGVDVNQAYPTNPFANESEIAIPGGIPSTSIISAKPILPGGGLGETIPNPNYGGGSR